MDVLFSVPVEPKGKPRAMPVRIGKSVRMVKTKDARQWADTLAQYAALYLPKEMIDEPVRVDIVAIHKRPAYMKRRDRAGEWKFPTGVVACKKKPDIDNIVKHVYDALRRFWTDDCLVVDGRAAKFYSELDGEPRIVIRIQSATALESDPWVQSMVDPQ